uniref:Carboxylic ester hydrolase n=1 Tax=Clastoptera arizonana TaxID=38151 RepID=A0A1B6CW08_9HEMI
MDYVYNLICSIFQTPVYVYVNTAQGTLRGKAKTTVNHHRYYAFLGIPYATPPLGPLRFHPPQPSRPWSGVRDVLVEGPQCPQVIPFVPILQSLVLGSEDCLYLNVFTPQLLTEGVPLKPVMVFIHGGGFFFGSGSPHLFGPELLIEEDVVLVTFNYRLGALGFLSLENDMISGNAGLKDQVLALRWVQQNIVNFGGDASRVTIFGQSAGGASVLYHMLSPLSRGLFNQVVIQSGSPLNPWAYAEKPLERAMRLANSLGFYSTNLDALNEFFLSVPAADLIRAQGFLLTDLERKKGYLTPFVPSVEVEGRGVKFLTVRPRELLEQGLFTKVPMIIGSLPGEGYLYLAANKLSTESFYDMNANWDWIIPDNILLLERDKLIVGNEIKQFYFRGKAISWHTINKLVTMASDEMFLVGIDQTLMLQLCHAQTPIYNYELVHEHRRSILKFLILFLYKSTLGFRGPAHSDDVPLFLSQELLKYFPFKESDGIVSQYLTKLLSNFARTGNPNDESLPVRWEPTTLFQRNHLRIGTTLRVINRGVQEQRMRFWHQIFLRNEPLY